MIAEQSGCKAYAVAWFDRVKQEVETRCAETLAQVQHMPVGLRWRARFLVDVQTARTERKRGVGGSLPQSATILAHLLTASGHRRWPKDDGAPLLLYRKQPLAVSDVEVAEIQRDLRRRDGATFVFPE